MEQETTDPLAARLLHDIVLDLEVELEGLPQSVGLDAAEHRRIQNQDVLTSPVEAVRATRPQNEKDHRRDRWSQKLQRLFVGNWLVRSLPLAAARTAPRVQRGSHPGDSTRYVNGQGQAFAVPPAGAAGDLKLPIKIVEGE